MKGFKAKMFVHIEIGPMGSHGNSEYIFANILRMTWLEPAY